jgi:L-ascorbate metabolism protein UlaG (beta-lactamase superfamily)
MTEILDKIHWLGNSAFFIDWPSAKIYIDPYQIKPDLPKADLILITHGHFDHYSPLDIHKIYQSNCKIIGSGTVSGKISYPIQIMKPAETFEFRDIIIESVSAYNPNKKFHPKSLNDLGYVLTLNKIRLYHAGDTDLIKEMENLKVDIAMLPIGGTYTMNAREAANAAKLIQASVIIPMHWGTSVGSVNDVEELRKSSTIEVRALKQE